MRNSTLTSSWLLAAVACVPALKAGEAIQLPNRLTFGPRVGFNVQADFSSSLPAPAANPGPAVGGGLDRTYGNGYVRVDSTGNADGKTWYWGYNNAGQVSLEYDAINMNAVTETAHAAVNDVDGDPYVGGELTYTRYFFEWGHANWGLELGGAFMPVEIANDSTLTGLVSSIRDAFSLGGQVPPTAPYAGTYQGPGVSIGDAPTRTFFQQEAAFTGTRRLETTAFGMRFGPNVEIPLGKPLWMQLSGGLYVLYSDTDFSYDETVTFQGLSQAAHQSASASQQDWTFGGYLRGQILWAFSPHWGIYGNVEYLLIDDIKITAGSNQAALDFGDSFGFSLGLAWSF